MRISICNEPKGAIILEPCWIIVIVKCLWNLQRRLLFRGSLILWVQEFGQQAFGRFIPSWSCRRILICWMILCNNIWWSIFWLMMKIWSILSIVHAMIYRAFVPSLIEQALLLFIFLKIWISNNEIHALVIWNIFCWFASNFSCSIDTIHGYEHVRALPFLLPILEYLNRHPYFPSIASSFVSWCGPSPVCRYLSCVCSSSIIILFLFDDIRAAAHSE